ncbi:MAG: aminopeptidase P family protein, partial [Rhodoluna sp.]
MRSRTPHSRKFLNYIGSNWAVGRQTLPKRSPVAPFAAKRRDAVAKAHKGSVLIFEAGPSKVRSNDTYYMYRPHSAFAHLTGWGSATVADSILVIDARGAKAKSTLFFRETAGRDSTEFYANTEIGEFWVGPRPDLKQVAALLGIETKSLSEYKAYFKSLPKSKIKNLNTNKDLAQFVSELRLIKDSYEIAEMRKAVAASVRGFEKVARDLKSAVGQPRGERIVETSFYAQARIEGNGLGYETISASGAHACTLHWIVNDGPIKKGDLLLLDAGVEIDSLYTADVTRTIPVSGKYTDVQRKIYEAVREAADAAFAVAKPGSKFRDLHAAAMKVIAEKTAEWGFLPVSAEESLKPENQFHRRWMVHGTSHHLGMDVHDCELARREMYLDAVLKPGMVFTIEPGLYFQPDDLMVPKEFRGIGVRIEDDVLITKTGVENLTKALPRK